MLPLTTVLVSVKLTPVMLIPPPFPSPVATPPVIVIPLRLMFPAVIKNARLRLLALVSQQIRACAANGDVAAERNFAARQRNRLLRIKERFKHDCTARANIRNRLTQGACAAVVGVGNRGAQTVANLLPKDWRAARCKILRRPNKSPLSCNCRLPVRQSCIARRQPFLCRYSCHRKLSPCRSACLRRAR